MTKTLVATPDPDPSPIIGSKLEVDKAFIGLSERFSLTPAQQEIVKVCDQIKQLLLTKNRKYGNSALNPIRIFSKSSPREQLLVRIDDKLNRARNQQDDEDEDLIKDLIGYLILLRVQDGLANEESI